MNKKNILISGALAIMTMTGATSCGNDSGSSTGANLADASVADSVMYYFGQVNASEYWRGAERDTTLASEEARQAYLRGLQAGMNAFKNSDDNYNAGMMRGLQMAMNIKEFNETYGISANPKIMFDSLKEGLANDSAFDEKAQAQFYEILGRLNAEKERKDREEATKNLIAYAGKSKMTKISDDIYASASASGDSIKLKQGDKVKLTVTATGLDGQAIDVPFPPVTEIGGRYSNPVMDTALESMSSGETRKFASTALALFGGRAERFGLKPDDVVILSIQVSLDNSAPSENVSNGDKKAGVKELPAIKSIPAQGATAGQVKKLN